MEELLIEPQIEKRQNLKQSKKRFGIFNKKRKKQRNLVNDILKGSEDSKDLLVSQLKQINHLDLISVELDQLIEADESRSTEVCQYLIFSSFAVIDGIKQKVLYTLVSSDISIPFYQRLLLRLKQLRFGYLYQEINQASASLLTSVYSQYGKEKQVEENRIEKSQWAFHFNQILEKAISLNSSDIHITATGQTAVVKVRVHGDLTEIDRYTYSDMLRLISSAYNQFASINSKDQSYSPHKTHETGIQRKIKNKLYQLRFISKPIYPAGSFDVTMRLIDETVYLGLDELGYSEDQIDILSKAMKQPNGIIIISGRVGSGKSRTMHSLSTQFIDQSRIRGVATKKLCTFEFPVEYKVKDAMQMEYKQDISRSEEDEQRLFIGQANHLLRMDSDACVISEIRGYNVAQLAIQLVQSDNIVFTTVHAQSALKIYNRLLGLGMDSDILTDASFFLSLVYQSLVKVACKHCGLSIDVYEDEIGDMTLRHRLVKKINQYHLSESLIDSVLIINAKGCDHCHFGIAGRSVVAEVIKPTVGILQAFKEGAYSKAHRLFREDKGVTYKEHALVKIFKGEICPLAYEKKISPLDSLEIYQEIDEPFYPKILNDINWGDA